MELRVRLAGFVVTVGSIVSSVSCAQTSTAEALERWQQAFYGVVLYKELKCKVTGFEAGMVSGVYDAEARLRGQAGSLVTRAREDAIREEVKKVATSPLGNCQIGAKGFEKIALGIIREESTAKAQAAELIARTEEAKRQEALRAQQEQEKQRAEAARRAAEDQRRLELERKAAADRAAAEAKAAADAKSAADAKAAAERAAADARVAEEKRLESERRAAEARAAAELRLAEAEQKRQEAELRLQAEKLASEREKAEQERKASAEKMAAEKQAAEERRLAEARLVEERKAAELRLEQERIAAEERLYRATCKPKVATAGLGARMISDPIKSLTLNSSAKDVEAAISHALATDDLKKAFNGRVRELVASLSPGEKATALASTLQALRIATRENCLFDAYDDIAQRLKAGNG